MNKMAIGGGVGKIINETSLYKFIAHTLKIMILNTLKIREVLHRSNVGFFSQKVDYSSDFTFS